MLKVNSISADCLSGSVEVMAAVWGMLLLLLRNVGLKETMLSWYKVMCCEM